MIIIFGVFWIIYGTLGLFGVQVIPERHRNREWTKQYKKARGIGWLLIGIPWCILYAAVPLLVEPGSVTTGFLCVLLILCSLPGMVYSFMSERKYNAMLQ